VCYKDDLRCVKCCSQNNNVLSVIVGWRKVGVQEELGMVIVQCHVLDDAASLFLLPLTTDYVHIDRL